MIKNTIKYLVKTYLRLGFFFYYKKIRIIGLERIPKHKPVFLLPNHQNALLDPLLIASHLPGFAHYLTRANVFKNPWIAKLLKFFGLVPIYRLRDGYASLGKNREVFDFCIQEFSKNGTLLAFPEANHNIQRRVRNLSKGFTRIVFQELETRPDTQLELLPIGLNYKQADQWPDRVSIYFGDPIPVQKYRAENPKEMTEHLRRNVQTALKRLTTDIPVKNYPEIEKQLRASGTDFQDPVLLNQWIASEVPVIEVKTPRLKAGLSAILKALLKVNLWLPYLIWKYYIRPRIQEKEFISTFRYSVAITFVPVYLLLIATILSIITGPGIALQYLLAVLLLALLSVKI
ncbi:MAG: glycerol acyltransferase [Gammaproteobacteria bacterium]|nr:glycerol acyltransferase [Gammaproteobacteria bacterium]